MENSTCGLLITTIVFLCIKLVSPILYCFLGGLQKIKVGVHPQKICLFRNHLTFCVLSGCRYIVYSKIYLPISFVNLLTGNAPPLFLYSFYC